MVASEGIVYIEAFFLPLCFCFVSLLSLLLDLLLFSDFDLFYPLSFTFLLPQCTFKVAVGSAEDLFIPSLPNLWVYYKTWLWHSVICFKLSIAFYLLASFCRMSSL